MSTKRTVRLAWTIVGLTTCLAVVMFGFNLLRPVAPIHPLRLMSDAVFSVAMPVVSAVVAALIVSRQPRNTIGWLLLVPVGLFLVGGPIEEYLERLAPSAPTPTLPLLLVVWFSGWSWLLLVFPLLSILLLFPNGKPPTPRWRWVGVTAVVWAVLFVLLVTFSQPLNSNTTPNLALDNPIGVRGDTVEALGALWVLGLLVLVVLCAAALVTRYRGAGGTEREQIKWLLYACAVFLVFYVGGIVNGITDSTGFAGSLWQVLLSLSVVAIPAAIGIAILRYRLYEIDVIIRRTLLYTVLTATLIGIYLGSVVLLQRILGPLLGGPNQLVVVVSTLLIAALVQPLRHRIQAFVDRRFFRRKYDTVKTLQAFNARVRDQVEMSTLTDDVLGVVEETLQPAHVSLWLRPTERN